MKKKGGNFVCKIFDVFTPFTVDLLFILYKHFEHFSIVKPVTSRPANSERYVVCKNLLEFQPKVIEYLFHVNQKFTDLNFPNNAENDIIRILPSAYVSSHPTFVEYICHSNLLFVFF